LGISIFVTVILSPFTIPAVFQARGRYVRKRMRSFCIVVQRGHEDLYDALRAAFQMRPGFYVLIDRRADPRARQRERESRERRATNEEWGGAHFLIAECWEPFGAAEP
jgi:hypothetical protein